MMELRLSLNSILLPQPPRCQPYRQRQYLTLTIVLILVTLLAQTISLGSEFKYPARTKPVFYPPVLH